ncbi:hypothetical protein HN51_016260 [Arachis hypogaea]
MTWPLLRHRLRPERTLLPATLPTPRSAQFRYFLKAKPWVRSSNGCDIVIVVLANDIHGNRSAEGERGFEQESDSEVRKVSVQGAVTTNSLDFTHSPPQPTQEQQHASNVKKSYKLPRSAELPTLTPLLLGLADEPAWLFGSWRKGTMVGMVGKGRVLLVGPAGGGIENGSMEREREG